jgi:hypothetical protein
VILPYAPTTECLGSSQITRMGYGGLRVLSDTFRPHGPLAAPFMHVTRSLPTVPRLVCTSLVVLLVVFAAGRCFHVLPRTLCEQTKTPTHKVAETVSSLRACATRRLTPLAPPRAVVRPVFSKPWAPSTVFPLLLAVLVPLGLAPGADALGISLPKAKRWAVLGGHGRHGAG